MLLTDKSSLNKLMVKLKDKISLGEGIRYSVPDLWNCFGYKGQEKFVDEKGVTVVNPYKFYFSCINDFIMPKKDITKDYNKSISQMLCNFNENKEYLGGDWIIKSSVYAMNIKISTAWDHNGSGFLEDCDENGFKETGTFLKTITLLPLLKKMGITTIYLSSISKFEIKLKEEFDSTDEVKNFSVIDSELKDTMLGEDFTALEEFSALVEACHILGLRVIIDIIPILHESIDLIKSDLFEHNEVNEHLWNSLSNVIPSYQNKLGIDGARLDMGHALPVELVHRIIESSRRIDNDFCFITEESFKGDAKLARENGCNMICCLNQSLDARISQCNAYEFMRELNILDTTVFVCAEALDKPRIAAGEDGKVLSKFLTILNEFLPNSVPVITSGLEVYETKPLSTSLELSWISDSRWDIPDTLETITKIRNEFLDTFTNPNNFLPINFESPYTTAIGFAYIVDGKRGSHNENVIIIVGNSDLHNSREYTLFLENIRSESGNGSKKAWLMYSQNEWSHDIYDFNHESDLQLSFKPGEVKILLM